MFVGQGSTRVSAEFYNGHARCWEPIIEPWIPQLDCSFGLRGKKIEVTNAGTLQCNISGAMMKNLIQYYRILIEAGAMKLSKTNIKQRQLNMYPVTFDNRLGIPLEILDHHTKRHVTSLEGNDLMQIDSTAFYKVYYGKDVDAKIFPRSRLQDDVKVPAHFYIWFKGD